MTFFVGSNCPNFVKWELFQLVLVTGISSVIRLHQLSGLFGFDKIGSWGSEQGSPVLSLLLTVIRAFHFGRMCQAMSPAGLSSL